MARKIRHLEFNTFIFICSSAHDRGNGKANICREELSDVVRVFPTDFTQSFSEQILLFVSHGSSSDS